MWRLSFVLKYPAAIAFTLIPGGAHSSAKLLVSCPTPPLLAAYGSTRRPPKKRVHRGDVDDLAPTLRFHHGNASWDNWKTELRFEAKVRSQSSGSTSAAGLVVLPVRSHEYVEGAERATM